jgi:hypothetical protein
LTRHLHHVPDPDPFTPEDGYSPGQLMTPACDEKGHTTQKRIAFRPTLFPVLNQIVASGQFEYRCAEDIVRDAVYHRIWYLADELGVTYDHRQGRLEGEIRHVVTRAAQIADLERMAQQRAERVTYVETLQTELDECRRLRDQGGFQLALSHAQARLDEPWLTEPYRSQVQAIVDKAGREIW